MGVFVFGASEELGHSLTNSDCECHLFTDPLTKSSCPANKSTSETMSSSLDISLSVGAYLGIGAEASCGFNLTYFVNELIEIFLE